jgi:hypothetical protein
LIEKIVEHFEDDNENSESILELIKKGEFDSIRKFFKGKINLE